MKQSRRTFLAIVGAALATGGVIFLFAKGPPGLQGTPRRKAGGCPKHTCALVALGHRQGFDRKLGNQAKMDGSGCEKLCRKGHTNKCGQQDSDRCFAGPFRRLAAADREWITQAHCLEFQVSRPGWTSLVRNGRSNIRSRQCPRIVRRPYSRPLALRCGDPWPRPSAGRRSRSAACAPLLNSPTILPVGRNMGTPNGDGCGLVTPTRNTRAQACFSWLPRSTPSSARRRA